MDIYFSDFFKVDEATLEGYGAFNISLINDLPLFIDPFLLFNNPKKEYQDLHNEIIKYLRFLKDVSVKENINEGLLKSWFLFPEVKQNWFGYSLTGNGGSGLGVDFAKALNKSLYHLFNDFGTEKITKSSHLEKLCLIKNGIGKDNISDFTTNLIKEYLLYYTEVFAKKYIDKTLRKKFVVEKVKFNYKTESWERGVYELPSIGDDYTLLTPKDLLTKDETWINKSDLILDFNEIAESIPNDALRSQVNNYFQKILPEEHTEKEYRGAISTIIEKFPTILDYYIKYKEDNGEKAKFVSKQKVRESESFYVANIGKFVVLLDKATDFYKKTGDTYDETYDRILFLKQVIENNDGYRIFYYKGQPIKREADLQILFRLTWFATSSDVNSEVNNGRGPVDYKISRGSVDKTLVEFKLASNKKLKQNLANQVLVYEKANRPNQSIKVILYFDEYEYLKVQEILKDLKLEKDKNIILIDASRAKPSASNVKSR